MTDTCLMPQRIINQIHRKLNEKTVKRIKTFTWKCSDVQSDLYAIIPIHKTFH